MNIRKITIGAAALAVVALAGCAAPGEDAGESPAADECDVVEHAMGLRWQQQSAEAQALQGQAYHFAGQRLEELVDEADDGADLAIITDLDETAVDNSELLARDLAACHDYSVWDSWDHWEREGEADLIPGALAFFERADELGVDIFYISDRTEENHGDTVALLETLGLPQVEDETVLLLGPPKEERRAGVQAEHEVIMQLGDTLHDFDAAFAGADLETQRALVEEHADRFGDDWIVLPNATYGSWEDAELRAWDAPLEIQE